eukprot:m51a1_g3817 hypothetical protein (1296) ;mRNA; r:271067-275828
MSSEDTSSPGTPSPSPPPTPHHQLMARVSLTLGKFEVFAVEGKQKEVEVQAVVHAKDREIGFNRRFRSDAIIECCKGKDGKIPGMLAENMISDLPLTSTMSIQLWKKGAFYSTKLGKVKFRIPEQFLKQVGEALMPLISTKSGVHIGNVAVTVEVYVDSPTLQYIAEGLRSGADWIYVGPPGMSLDKSRRSDKGDKKPKKGFSFLRIRTGAKQGAPSSDPSPRRATRVDPTSLEGFTALNGDMMEDLLKASLVPLCRMAGPLQASLTPRGDGEQRLGSRWEVGDSDIASIMGFIGQSTEQKLKFADMQGVTVLLEVLGFYAYKAASPRASDSDLQVIADIITALEGLLSISAVAEGLLKPMNTSMSFLVRALPFTPPERMSLVFNWMFMFFTMLNPNTQATDAALISSTEVYRKAVTVAVLNEMTLRVHGIVEEILSDGDEATRLSCLHFIHALIESQDTAESRRAIREHFAHDGINLLKIMDIIPSESTHDVMEIAKKIQQSCLADATAVDIDAEVLEMFKVIMSKAKATLCMDDLSGAIRALANSPAFSVKLHEVCGVLSAEGAGKGVPIRREARLDVGTEATQTDFSDLASVMYPSSRGGGAGGEGAGAGTGAGFGPGLGPGDGSGSGLCPKCGKSFSKKKREDGDEGPESDEEEEEPQEQPEQRENPDIPVAFLRVVEDILRAPPSSAAPDAGPVGAPGVGPKVVPIKVERMIADEVKRTVFADVGSMTNLVKVDRDTLRGLFTTVIKATKVKVEKKVEIVYCLPQQRRQNVDMFLRKNKIETDTLRAVLLDPPPIPRVEDAEIFERLAEILTLRAPKDEKKPDPDREEKMMREFEPKSAFSKPEQFLWDLYQIPRVRQKLVGVGLRATAQGLFETASEDVSLVMGTLEMLSAPQFKIIMAYLLEITREVGKGTAWERTAGLALSTLSDVISTKLQAPTSHMKLLADWLVEEWYQKEPDIVPFVRELYDKVTASMEALKRFELVFPQALECLFKIFKISDGCTEPSEEKYKTSMLKFIETMVQKLYRCADQLDAIDARIVKLGDNKAEPLQCMPLKKAIEQTWSRVIVPEYKKSDLDNRMQRDFLRYALLHSVKAFLTTVKAVSDRMDTRDKEKKAREQRDAAKKEKMAQAGTSGNAPAKRPAKLPPDRANKKAGQAGGHAHSSSVTRAEAAALIAAIARQDPQNKIASDTMNAMLAERMSAAQLGKAVGRKRKGALGLLDEGSAGSAVFEVGGHQRHASHDLLGLNLSAIADDERWKRASMIGLGELQRLANMAAKQKRTPSGLAETSTP